MNQLQLGKVWLVVSALLLYYALNSWIVAQGGNEIFGAKLIVSHKAPIAMIAIPVSAVLLIISSLVGRLYAHRGGGHWHERIPIVGFESINTASREGRNYQGTMLVIFTVVPILALSYFWWVFATSPVMVRSRPKDDTISVWDWSGLTTLNDPARICTDFDAAQPDPCFANATVLPGLEAMIFVVLTLAALFAVLWHWTAIASKPAQRMNEC